VHLPIYCRWTQNQTFNFSKNILSLFAPWFLPASNQPSASRRRPTKGGLLMPAGTEILLAGEK